VPAVCTGLAVRSGSDGIPFVQAVEISGGTFVPAVLKGSFLTKIYPDLFVIFPASTCMKGYMHLPSTV